jgi:hypothetical protein
MSYMSYRGRREFRKKPSLFGDERAFDAWYCRDPALCPERNN